MQDRQHCRLTYCIELAELTNSIRQQDPNIYSDTEARCLVWLIMVMNKEGSILMMANLRQRNPPHHPHDHLRPTDHLLCIDNTGWRWRR